MNQVPVNQVPMNQVLVNQVHVNLGVRAPKNICVRVRKPSERINKNQIKKEVFPKDGK